MAAVSASASGVLKSQSPDEEDDQTILRELCTVNGINYEKLQMGGGSKVNKLEIFFFGFPRVVGLQHFPNLTSLCVINQKISRLSGLESCTALQELWVCEGQIEHLEGLEYCSSLVQLHLYSNCISRIQGLTSLTRLEKLWLNGNRISTIEGLETLCRLRNLNLAGNQITTVGQALEGFSELEVLDLSGNKLSALQELVNLGTLSKLHTLSLCQPLYPPNPVCQLCNYSTHALFHLPSLHWLDGRDVSVPELHKLVQGLVTKKKQFYRMKVHHARQVARQQCQALRQQLSFSQQPVLRRIRTLSQRLKTLHYDPELLGKAGSTSETLNRRVAVLTRHTEQLVECCQQLCNARKASAEQVCQQWLAELESGGNIKFTRGDPSQPWYKSCQELVSSRFSVADVQALGITGITVEGVVRVENRALYQRFSSRLSLLLGEEPYSTHSHTYQQLLDYLFLTWHPELDVNRVCQRGCEPGEGGSVLMANSVTLADACRLQGSEKRRREGLHGLERGQLVLCKVFIGQMAEAKSCGHPVQSAFPSVDCVFQQRGHTHIPSSHQREWFIFHPEMVVPEYIIEFCYSSQSFVPNPLDHMMSHDPVGQDQPSDDQLLALEPSIQARPRLAMLDEPTLLKLTGEDSLPKVKVLNLHDNHLSRFRLAGSLPQLTQLILSFNSLTSTVDLQHMPCLELLDLSFNKLSSLEGIKSLPKLRHLDISWNELTNWYEDTAVLRKHTPTLQTLDTRYNPWTTLELFRSHTLGWLKCLKQLNGTAVSQEESDRALRRVVTSHLSLSTLLSHAHTYPHLPPSLTLTPTPEALHKGSRYRPTQLTSCGTNWTSKVTCVSVRGLGLHHLACLEQLPNLRWLSLASNNLTSIESLALCPRLEELVLDDNHLVSLEPLKQLHQLRWVSAQGNLLGRLSKEVTEVLKSLEYLNVSNNDLSTLHGIQYLPALAELYASGNQLPNLRELFHLKPLSQLVVLDLSYNPLTTGNGYRHFAIYHLPPLKALDGQPVDKSEQAMAREKLGGRLTQDLIFERLPGVELSSLRQLDLPHCGLRHVELSPVENFHHLASLNLQHNNLFSLAGLVRLRSLKVLCLNYNHVECMTSSQDPLPAPAILFPSLQVLHLAYNDISNLVPLQLGRIPSLKALFLQGNEISRVEGLQGLECLTELVLDRNKIKALQESSLASLHSLRELHMEENRLRDLSHFSSLLALERLYLGMNRVQEYGELEKLVCLPQLLELSVMSNPVSRRGQHRSLCVYHLPSLLVLDGVPVSPEERQAAHLSFSEEQEPEGAPETALPGLASSAPLKVMNVPFGPTPSSHMAPPPAQRRRQLEARTVHLQQLQALHERRRGRR